MTSSDIETPSLLRHPSFMRYWGARTLSFGSFQIMSVVVGWQIYALTHSTFDLGLVGLMQFLPMVLTTIPAGHVADRFDRRRVACLCQIIEAAVAAALAYGSYEGILTKTVIFAAMALLGASRTFEQPAMAALLPAIVSAKALPTALAISASATETATIVGPAMGGFLYIAGPTAAYACVSIFCLGASLLIGTISAVKGTHREPPTLRSLFSGIAYVRDNPMVLGAISLDLFAVLLGGATALLPVFARDILHTGPVGLGILRGAPAIGALTMSVVLARNPLRKRAGLIMFAAVACFGLGTIVFGLSSWFPLSLVALIVMGASDVVSVVIRGTLVQIATPDAMRGRVSAVNSMFIGTSNQLGEFESGFTAFLFGTIPAVVIGGAGTVLVAILWSRLFPSLRMVDDLSAQSIMAGSTAATAAEAPLPAN